MKVTDTLSAAKAYQKGGFNQNQAETLADQHELMAQELVAHIGQALDSRFAHLEPRFAQIETRFAQMEAKIEGVARDQLFKIIVVVLSGAGLTVAILSFLFALVLR